MERDKLNILYGADLKITQCTRLLHSGLKKYNPLLYSEVMKYVKSMKSEKGMQEHTFKLSEVDSHVLGDLSIQHLGSVIYSISCKDILYEYTIVEPVVYKGRFIPGTKSALTNKIKFKIDYLQMYGKI